MGNRFASFHFSDRFWELIRDVIKQQMSPTRSVVKLLLCDLYKRRVSENGLNRNFQLDETETRNLILTDNFVKRIQIERQWTGIILNYGISWREAADSINRIGCSCMWVLAAVHSQQYSLSQKIVAVTLFIEHQHDKFNYPFFRPRTRFMVIIVLGTNCDSGWRT